MTKKHDDTLKTDPSLPDITASEVEESKKEGVLEAVKEGAKVRYAQTDGTPFGEDPDVGIVPTYDVFQLQHVLELDPKALKELLEGKDKAPDAPGISQGQAAGLIEVERSGKNRSDIVKALCDYLGLKSPYEVTDAGPGWTNRVDRDIVSRG